MGYGFFYGRFRIKVTPIPYSNVHIPDSFQGYKIVVISDLHLSSFDYHLEALERVVDSINAQRPDLICFLGDIVTINVQEAMPYIPILKELQSQDGIISVLGNHDMMIYTSLPSTERDIELARMVAVEQDSLGWVLLRNTHHTLTRCTDTLTFIGVDNASCGGQGFRTINSGDLTAAQDGTNGFRILLSHDPTLWRAEVLFKTDIPLTLSGHTHAGQVRLFGHALSDILFSEKTGWNHEGQQDLYVTSGIGCTLPIRINSPSEITVITLQ